MVFDASISEILFFTCGLKALKSTFNITPERPFYEEICEQALVPDELLGMIPLAVCIPVFCQGDISQRTLPYSLFSAVYSGVG